MIESMNLIVILIMKLILILTTTRADHSVLEVFLEPGLLTKLQKHT